MNVDDLEGAINSAKGESASGESEKNDVKPMSEEAEVGFHKGALNTLAGERNELLKMLHNVEGIMGAHVKRLKEMGVDLK